MQSVTDEKKPDATYSALSGFLSTKLIRIRPARLIE